uniref:glucuronosyltransferase n=1 Tax=Strongyloides venezuelensis TaxID=75913 RepID=A0A0K0F3F5_STRVS
MPEDIKNEREDGTGKDIENLVISNWLLQSDLLNDERLSLFVTGGSMDSITDLSFRGVPAAVTSVVGDQYRNAKLVERQNYSIIMDKSDLTNPNILIKNISTILEDETFKYNDEMVSRRLSKRAIGSKRLLIEHIEFAAEFGRLDMLDSSNMGMIEYYNLDIIFPVMFGLFILIFLYHMLYLKWLERLRKRNLLTTFLKYFILFNLFLLLHSYKILIVNPKIGYSHVNFFSQIADILTEAGHNVTVLAIDLDPTVNHPGAYKANVITFPTTKEIEDNFRSENDNRMLWNLTSGVSDQ